MKIILRKIAASICIFCAFFALTANACNAENGEITAFSHIDDGMRVEFAANSENGGVRVSSRIYELLFGNKQSKKEETYLIPGGEIFGIRIKQDYLTVSSSGSSCGLIKGDKIISVGKKEIKTADDVSAAIRESGGKPVEISILRAGEKMTLTVTPHLDGDSYKLGITLRGAASGIGTVTFIDPETGVFGGLGHGVCEPESGNIVKADSGEVCSAILGGIKRGEAGKPGELAGVLGKRHIGSIEENNECGVFGKLNEVDTATRKAIPVGFKDEIKEGEAEIISTVKNGKTMRYKIEITSIDKSSTGSKSFKIKVTDPTLLTLTGGIVRGMSGSPIIQNGKLIGAVTHVMVADPTEGYGIFIENMLNASSARNELPRAA